MGIHGSPTCTMAYGENGGAVAYLIGECNRGIEYMFVMMNDARFGVSVQGVGLAERAYQMALCYANERVQGRNTVTGEMHQPIIKHADVKRQLLSMRTRLFAMRALVYTAAGWFDHASHNPHAAVAGQCRRYIDLLMPVLKAWNTETGNIVCDDAIQIFGGMGFIEETGVAQHYRDSRVTRLYEGTTGIQANDLVSRKILRDNGVTLREIMADIRAEASALAGIAELAGHSHALLRNVDDLDLATAFLLKNGKAQLATVQVAAVPFLHLTGLVCAGWRVAEASRAAYAALSDSPENGEYLHGVMAIADVWFASYAPQVHAYAQTVLASSCVAAASESAWLA